AAARAGAQKDGEGTAAAAGAAAVSDWLAPEVQEPGNCSEEITVTVRIEVPRVLPVFDFGTATRTVTMPCD
ncbi:TadE/TadG family type IV pilus assembly protein, partial [Streptomyces sp. NPDC055078]